MKTILRLMVCLVTWNVMAAGALAQDGQVNRDELRARFEQRSGELARLKTDGTVGETWQGFVEAVSGGGGGSTSTLISEENADRRALFAILAQETNEENKRRNLPEVTAADIARVNALRRFNRAASEEFLKIPDAGWIRKKDADRHRNPKAVKSSGKVGETWEGFLEAVTADAARDAAVVWAVEWENDFRRSEYERVAKEQRSTWRRVGEDRAAANFAAAAPNEFLKDRDGTWKRKRDRR